MYIRIGNLPEGGKSAIYSGMNAVGKEIGVSVYECVRLNGKYRIVMPSPMKLGQGNTYEALINEVTEQAFKIPLPRKVYLVKGTLIGYGHDGEPLLNNVKIMREITNDFLI